MKKRSTFGSRFGTIVVVGGSVVGLGNIWRFPYIAGENGGAAFVFIYILISLMISVPIMLSEFAIGRSTKRNALRAFKKLSDGGWWHAVGYLGIATAFVILAFYCVIAGWTMEFIRESVAGSFIGSDSATIKANFDGFVASGWKPVVWAGVFVGLNTLIVMAGVEKGIERYNKILMPLMFLILLGLAINSVTLSGFADGVRFLWNPDFSKISLNVIMEALGQSFFSMSLGMGTMITYGSYINRRENMFRLAGTVAVSDVVVAILAGLAIFPAVFSFGISPTSGPELVFLTLPNIFAQMAGGYFISILFFLLLFSAAITSSVSLMEVVVAYACEEFRISRRMAAMMASATVAVLATLCAVSQMPDSALTVGGLNLFDFFNNVSSDYMLPIGAFMIVIFAGWKMSRQVFANELTNGATVGMRIYTVLRPMIRYVIPLVIAMLFLSGLGLLTL